MKRIVFSSPFVPPELIEAYNLQPVRITPGGADATPGPGQQEGLCPYVRAFVSEVCRDEHAAAAVLTTTCDQMRRAEELIHIQSELPVFLLNVPATWQTIGSRRLYRSELERLGRFLLRLGGSEPAPDKLASVIREYDDARARLKGMRRQLTAKGYAETLSAFQSSRAVSSTYPAGDTRKDRIPVILLGGPLPAEEFWLFDAVEEAGGEVVVYGTENGDRTMPAPLERRRVRAKPLEFLAEAYWGTIPDVFQRPNSRLYEWLRNELTEHAARGIIIRHYVWCDLWHAEVRRMSDWSDVPVLHLDVEQGFTSRERTLTRIQAFFEVLR